MNVRGASSLTDGSLVHEILDLVLRKKLPGVVGVKRTDYLDGSGLPLVHVSVERGHVGLELGDGFALLLHEVHGLEATVIVGEHEHVLEVANNADTEGSHDVGVNEPPDVRRLVDRWGGVALSRRIGFHAVNAGGTLSSLEILEAISTL